MAAVVEDRYRLAAFAALNLSPCDMIFVDVEGESLPNELPLRNVAPLDLSVGGFVAVLTVVVYFLPAL